MDFETVLRAPPPGRRAIARMVCRRFKGKWRGPAGVKRYRRFRWGDRLTFDLGGVKYRMVVHVSYDFARLLSAGG